jgi:hypothetical protein
MEKEVEIDLDSVPNRKLTDVQKQTISLRIELSKLQREEAILILNKSIFLFFAFLAIGFVGYINGFLSNVMLNFFIIVAAIALVIGILPYSTAAKKEQKALKKLLEELTK